MSVVELAGSDASNALITNTFMNLLEQFRFERVEKAMQALDWKWSVLPNGKKLDAPIIPSLNVMKEQCWNLFTTCMKSLADDSDLKETYWSGGGFCVEVNRETRLVHIGFEVEYACNYP